MPRGQVSPSVSNLSVLVPRDVHRRVRLALLRSGGQSMGAVVAWWLNKIPESVSPSEMVEVMAHEMKIAALMKNRKE